MVPIPPAAAATEAPRRLLELILGPQKGSDPFLTSPLVKDIIH